MLLNTFPADAQLEIYASRGVSPINVQNYSSLYDLVWKPIDPYMSNINKIFMTTSGLLHRLNFNALEFTKIQFWEIGIPWFNLAVQDNWFKHRTRSGIQQLLHCLVE